MAVITLETVNIQKFRKNADFREMFIFTTTNYKGITSLIRNSFDFFGVPSLFQDEPFIQGKLSTRFYSIVWYWNENVTRTIIYLCKQIKIPALLYCDEV